MEGNPAETILALTKDLPPLNYIGATIFWLSIATALVLTAVVLKTIFSLPQPRNGFSPQVERATNVFAGLATLSFWVLSFNMLNVLIKSYQAWYQLYRVRGDSFPQRIWTWSITSNLFRDFGEAILASQARYFWTIVSLFATMAVFNYMGIEGQPAFSHLPLLFRAKPAQVDESRYQIYGHSLPWVKSYPFLSRRISSTSP